MFVKDSYIANTEVLAFRSPKTQAFPIAASLFNRLFILYTMEWFHDKSHEPLCHVTQLKFHC